MADYLLELLFGGGAPDIRARPRAQAPRNGRPELEALFG
jgi:hypothetical protein